MKVLWRDWYNDATVKKLEKMGTLDVDEFELNPVHADTGETVAVMIAEAEYERDNESFREGGDIVIISPEKYAGTYKVVVDYDPVFYAYKEDDDR